MSPGSCGRRSSEETDLVVCFLPAITKRGDYADSPPRTATVGSLSRVKGGRGGTIDKEMERKKRGRPSLAERNKRGNADNFNEHRGPGDAGAARGFPSN